MLSSTRQLYTESSSRSSQTYIVATAFLSLFALVGFAYYGLPFFFDFMTKEFGWSRTVVTLENALGKLLVGALIVSFLPKARKSKD
jgi:ABC-type multidrug transport system permease subunit